ncbi:DUF1878 family protein [Cytobacillus suaedae]|nr:DUF1878 family protein [Cytobacillus suaedae]
MNEVESLEARIERLEYYQTLLFDFLNTEKAAFYKLIVKSQLSKNEVNELLNLCESMDEKFKQQKAEGFVTFTPLLTEFVGMLHSKLEVKEVIDALINHGMYLALMYEFKKLLNTLD